MFCYSFFSNIYDKNILVIWASGKDIETLKI